MMKIGINKQYNHDGDFYCLNCFHSYRTKNTLEAHEKICEIVIIVK